MSKCLLLIALCAAALLFPTLAVSQYQETDHPPGHPSQIPEQARVDINHAALPELMKVPGITRSWAERIIRFRPYRSKQDLLLEGVLPDDMYFRVADYIIAHQKKK